jgi:hypothetical protein
MGINNACCNSNKPLKTHELETKIVPMAPYGILKKENPKG